MTYVNCKYKLTSLSRIDLHRHEVTHQTDTVVSMSRFNGGQNGVKTSRSHII